MGPMQMQRSTRNSWKRSWRSRSVAAGASGHLVGGALLAIVLGLAPAMIVMTAILVLQALVFQDGGLLALGANVFNMAVAGILADMRLDAVAVAAGLLHDVVEDTHVTSERVAELFGSDVAHVVAGVTKISAIHFASSEERQAESFRKMLLAMVDDIRVILVKLADRLHNMRTIEGMSMLRRRAIARETLDIYAPLAGRMVTFTIGSQSVNATTNASGVGSPSQSQAAISS